jgi:hypothetical protein
MSKQDAVKNVELVDSGDVADTADTADKDNSASDASNRPREIGGRGGLDPTRYGDWEKAGRCIDF